MEEHVYIHAHVSTQSYIPGFNPVLTGRKNNNTKIHVVIQKSCPWADVLNLSRRPPEI